MALVDKLLENSATDRDLLGKNLKAGDQPYVPRDAEFVLYARTRGKADVFCSFIHDNGYGRASFCEVPELPEERRYRVIVAVRMPTEEHIVCSVSGMMLLLGELFSLEYDGWGSSLQTKC